MLLLSISSLIEKIGNCKFVPLFQKESYLGVWYKKSSHRKTPNFSKVWILSNRQFWKTTRIIPCWNFDFLISINIWLESENVFKSFLTIVSVKKKALKDSSLPDEVKTVKQQVMNYQYKKKLRKCDKEIIKILDMKVSNFSNWFFYSNQSP